MSWAIIIVLTGFLSWLTLERAYQGPTGREDRSSQWRFYVTISLLVVFSIVVMWQLFTLLKPILG